MKRVAIIQARMGSSRLPGKVLLPLAGRPVLEWVVSRARLVPGLDEVGVATTTEPGDDELAGWCRRHGVPVFRGSESDVLERYRRCAREWKADVVMRITADCPLLDPHESERVLRLFEATPGCEYCSNVEPPFLPHGLDTEVVSSAALERLGREAQDPESREHVTLFIRRQATRFTTASVWDDRDLADWRLTLDEPADYESLGEITAVLVESGLFGSVGEVVSLLEQRPGLARRCRRPPVGSHA